MSKPVAVIISDVHYSLTTLEVADACFRMAIDKAAELGVPLIDGGDLTNDKAILRAEVVNRLIDTFMYANNKDVVIYCLVGNHSLCNEKGEEHSLNFLEPWAEIIDEGLLFDKDTYLLAYHSDSADLANMLKTIPAGSTIIMHQGVMGANMGHYVQDKTSLPKEAFADFRAISGHYHARQDIKCGRPRKGAIGLFSYVGNPYTLTFGEAHDPQKGFQILNDDGTLTFVPTHQRKHMIIEAEVRRTDKRTELVYEPFNYVKGDIVWVKLTGARSVLDDTSRDYLSEALGIEQFKLDKIPLDAEQKSEVQSEEMTGEEVFDSIIDRQADSAEHKSYLKSLWRDIVK